MNTCYGLVNLGAKGGSSGSPVVSKATGAAIGILTSGEPTGAACYFLPLDMPVRALSRIQERKPVSRGDIHCQFLLRSLADCGGLGLSQEEIGTRRASRACFPGLLVAKLVVPNGFSCGKIREGDILLRVNAEIVEDFVRFGDILDSRVGQALELELLRGGVRINAKVKVDDLHRITPNRFVAVAGATFQDLSYQLARSYSVPIAGVHVCDAEGSFFFGKHMNGWIIETLDKQRVGDLDEFLEVMQRIPDNARVLVTYRNLRNRRDLERTTISINRHWPADMKLAVRNDETGLWDFCNIGSPLPPVKPIQRSASTVKIAQWPGLFESFVHVRCTMPVALDGFPFKHRTAMGLVIDASRGLAVVSRAVVPHEICDITVTIASTVDLRATVLFMHPLHGYTVIRYDPSLVDANIHTAVLCSEPLQIGSKVRFFGFTGDGRTPLHPTTVIDVGLRTFPVDLNAPRNRVVNVSSVSIDSNLAPQCHSGVLLAADGTVRALWLSTLGESIGSGFVSNPFALDTSSLSPVLSAIRHGAIPKLRILPILLEELNMLTARIMGVSEHWAVKMGTKNRNMLFVVKATTVLDSNRSGLREGDIILELDGKLCTKVSDFDVMYSKGVLYALIVRDGKELALRLTTTAFNDIETDCAVHFCGALLQPPPLVVRQSLRELPSQVYVSFVGSGSPAERHILSPVTFITHVDEQPTRDLDDFVFACSRIRDDTGLYFLLY